MIKEKLNSILDLVEKPARYIGMEMHSIQKADEEVNVRFAFAFPDTYEVGMSHLGLHILYQMINREKGLQCERVFAPWTDMEAVMRSAEIPLYTLESYKPLSEMDVVGFTLQYELSYTNILNMLNLGGIPMLSKDRGAEDPIVIAGGPCAFNPEPLAEIMDLFVIGEGEAVTLELLRLLEAMKLAPNFERAAFLKAASQLEGIYVPSFYDVKYNEDGTLAAFKALEPEAPSKIRKRLMKDLNQTYFPDKFIVPFIDTVHDRAMVELFRGCTRGCRFCQAGMIYRPIRERSSEEVVRLSEALLASTGYEELSLTSLSTLDHSEIRPTIEALSKLNEDAKIGLSLPSLRLDSFSVEVLKEIQKVRKTGLTFAPEAGTQRMRDIINKNVDEQDLTETMRQIFELGWDKVKLYFMIGLPYETMEDVDGINDLGNLVTGIHKHVASPLKSKGLSVTISASCFVPKPFTPFQWEPQDSLEQFEEKQRHLKQRITNKKIKFSYHDARTSRVEAVFARGDRRVGKALIEAWKSGARFDGWGDYFSYERWVEAFEKTGLNMDFFATRKRSYSELLPWDHIDAGVDKHFLVIENENAKTGKVTQDCRDGCIGCGVNVCWGGLC
ncbi:TIGR03960 family B12-binding radical SAM protein [Acidaminobacter hydrogenoformans]|uniref:Radical SAM family uncharacterized protein n=1 Tax=Acidaminobacter hydrogenoformans DSM 2784 TaxID=1120920 RepID=A0A1G5RSX8_9FIRM|nr:TIGR03960 family B12-binding radical SAM protein [Acidaminobacter hydrogenoformans]SCZ77204.1 radical SAM family uncharacterized protein [Acidaminobacter hydrogenoformans DSM 2784]